MKSFPHCQHTRKKTAPKSHLTWLASEPFRLFFVSGVLWSLVGVSLWPLFYAGGLGYFPSFVHARLMIEAFGGAFVVGFLGTAGPRMAGAPKLTSAELIWLFVLHQGSAFCHLAMHHGWGDRLFALLLISLILALVIRVARFGREWPPPQMWLALTGLLCGFAGALMLSQPSMLRSPEMLRLAALLLYQGLLLPPVLGIGSFLFPRILGGDFGEAKSPRVMRQKQMRAAVAALLVVSSFFIEAYGSVMAGCLLRAFVALGYLLFEVCWRKKPQEPRRGTLARGLQWSLGFGLTGLLLAALFPMHRISVEHLLYAGGFGLLMLVVGSRVLFGHSGDLEGFDRRSWMARAIVLLALLASSTRATTGFLPHLTVSHHVYAALSWVILAVLWLIWHRQRFVTRDE